MELHIALDEARRALVESVGGLVAVADQPPASTSH